MTQFNTGLGAAASDSSAACLMFEGKNHVGCGLTFGRGMVVAQHLTQPRRESNDQSAG
ncbi:MULTISPECIES: hypothetical protein [Spiribacter]|uniref:hypothetical protein n=1 Tax=Spiribacter TaxID=1335745 RepID=UPI00132F8A4F|nr:MULTISPECIES: hypothetical protein [Spiribacter]